MNKTVIGHFEKVRQENRKKYPGRIVKLILMNDPIIGNQTIEIVLMGEDKTHWYGFESGTDESTVKEMLKYDGSYAKFSKKTWRMSWRKKYKPSGSNSSAWTPRKK